MAEIIETVWYSPTFLASFPLFFFLTVVFFHLFHHLQLFHLDHNAEEHHKSLKRNETHPSFLSTVATLFTPCWAAGIKLVSEFTVISLMVWVLVSAVRVAFLRSFNKACVTSSDPCKPGRCGHAEITLTMENPVVI